MKDFRPAKKGVEVSVGESVRILRELQGLSQNQLAELNVVPQATLSAIENDRVRLGVERSKVLARARSVVSQPCGYFQVGKFRLRTRPNPLLNRTPAGGLSPTRRPPVGLLR